MATACRGETTAATAVATTPLSEHTRGDRTSGRGRVLWRRRPRPMNALPMMTTTAPAMAMGRISDTWRVVLRRPRLMTVPMSLPSVMMTVSVTPGACS
jgi:hypothetical protein